MNKIVRSLSDMVIVTIVFILGAIPAIPFGAFGVGFIVEAMGIRKLDWVEAWALGAILGAIVGGALALFTLSRFTKRR